jgi:hypothetical protein
LLYAFEHGGIAALRGGLIERAFDLLFYLEKPDVRCRSQRYRLMTAVSTEPPTGEVPTMTRRKCGMDVVGKFFL